MIMPAASGKSGPGRPAGWLVLTASERGAAHVAVKTPNQDSVAVERAAANGVVTAVADGHGHSRHLRSAKGSRFAVTIGCRVGQEFADKLAADRLDEPTIAPTDAEVRAERIADLATEFLVPTIVDRWREAVLGDVEADPFTDAEERKRRRGDNPTIAYGSTLLLCVAVGDWLVLAQVGDGDVVGVRTDGTATLPVPADPQLDGLVTTSLCGPHAASDFRVAIVNTTRTPLLAAALATDGYGNAQVVEEWPSSFSKDLAWLLREHDMRWLASQLPAWAARCASADGSADDTTVALLISPAGQTAHDVTVPARIAGSTAVEPDPGSDEITIPAVVRTDTMPSGHTPSGHSPIEPITVHLQADQVTTEHMTTEEIAAVDIAGQITADWEPPGPSAGSSIR
jgi:serine/threonine protein phosphatase PrpC